MKFATALPWAGPAATAGNLLAYARTAEELGFDHALTVMRHFAAAVLPDTAGR